MAAEALKRRERRGILAGGEMGETRLFAENRFMRDGGERERCFLFIQLTMDDADAELAARRSLFRLPL